MVPPFFMSNQPNKLRINTVGDLRRALAHCDDNESLVLELDTVFKIRKEIDINYVGSSGGGRITVLGFEFKKSTFLKGAF